MLEIKNIYKTFNAGTVNEKRALNGLSLQVYGRWMKARSLLMVLM